MTWPASDVDVTDADADGDSPLAFRQDVQDLITKFNQLRNHVTTYLRTLLDDTDATAARSTLGLGSAAVEPTTTFWSTGDVKLTYKAAADAGWVMMNDGTIGDGLSGGTTRANADTEPLFTLLWNNTANAQCAVSSGRGASAAADFAAHKTIALPKALGRAMAVSGAGSGLTSRALALANGVETKTIGTTNLPASGLSIPSLSVSGSVANHTHGQNTGNSDASGSLNWYGQGAIGNDTLTQGYTQPMLSYPSGAQVFTDGATPSISGSTGTGTTGNMGSGNALDIMNPMQYMNAMIKL